MFMLDPRNTSESTENNEEQKFLEQVWTKLGAVRNCGRWSDIEAVKWPVRRLYWEQPY